MGEMAFVLMCASIATALGGMWDWAASYFIVSIACGLFSLARDD